MRTFAFFFILAFSLSAYSQNKTIHVFVALCDNVNQGIVRVPAFLGNGKKPSSNLYWGAAFGVRSFFDKKSTDWDLVTSLETNNLFILERLLFKHKSKQIYMLADAYDGERIIDCVEDFLKASNGQNPIELKHNSTTLNFGGNSELLSYVGHDGLMEFSANVSYKPTKDKKIDVIVLACFSKDFFEEDIRKANANPILWTTNLMAPEAYTLKAAIDGWMLNESGPQLSERAAQAYNKYQKCGIKGARNLFTTGF